MKKTAAIFVSAIAMSLASLADDPAQAAPAPASQPAQRASSGAARPLGAQNGAQNDPYETALAILGRISASKPEAPLLASLFQLRPEITDADTRDLIDKFVAAGMIASRQSTTYLRRIRPQLKDPAAFEDSLMLKCANCDGSGKTLVKCDKCGGAGHCLACGGTGKVRVNTSLSTFKKPTQAHSKGNGENDIKEVACKVCRGTGHCPVCGTEGRRARFCESCAGGGKIWDMAAVTASATGAYDELVGALRIKVHGERIAQSVVRVKADDETFSGPAFTFGEYRVVAIPARRMVGVDSLTLYTADRKPLPFTSIFAARNCDLVLLDIADSSLVKPLKLETVSSMMDEGRTVVAYGLSRELGSVAKLSGKITALGAQYAATNVKSETLADGAILLTDSGSVGAIFMYPITEVSTLGTITLAQRSGMALRLDNLYPDDFIRVQPDTFKSRNDTLLEARKAISSARDLLAENDNALAKRKADISDAVKRLDKTVEMIRNVKAWEVFTMAETAKELSDEAEVRAKNLEARLAAINEAEVEAKRAEAARIAAEKEAAATKVMETESAPALSDGATSGAARPQGAQTSSRPAPPPPEPETPWGMIAGIAIAVIVAITGIFILMGKVMDERRKRKAATPGVIPKFVRDMKKGS